MALRLRDRAHVIALDLRGHGGSQWAPNGAGGHGYSFGDYVDDVAQVIELLGWGQPLVMGHSLGGYLAAQFAATHPLHHLGAAAVAERAPGVWQYAFDRRVFLHPPPDPWPFLPRVQCPLLVIRGGGSAVMTREAAERVAGAARQGSVAELPGAFHHLIVDDPAGFVARVESWRVGGHAR